LVMREMLLDAKEAGVERVLQVVISEVVVEALLVFCFGKFVDQGGG
jgi:hypothetical protein